MSRALALLSLAFAAVSAADLLTYPPERAVGDKITQLPGAPAVTFDQYSGYISISDTKSIFYWLQMSTRHDDPSNIPVIVWTNGGPGCSGLLGALLEQGAFRMLNETNLQLNPGAWNGLAHMIFIEQPAGVGFSYSTDSNDYTTGDSQAVADMYQFIVNFFQAFPTLASNPFYFASESYGGHYAPQTAKYIVDHNDGSINFKGFLVGNPYTDPVENARGMYDTFFGHSLISLPLWNEFETTCKDGEAWNTAACQNVMNALETAVGDVYPYGLDWPNCVDSGSVSTFKQRTWFMDKVLRKLGRGQGFKAHDDMVNLPEDMPQSDSNAIYNPCQQNYETTYLRSTAVQQALHAKVGTNWDGCSGAIKWNQTDFEIYQEPYYQYLINGGYDLHIMVFSGDDDSVCGTVGTQSWIYNLGYSTNSPWQAWNINENNNGEQVAGYWTRFVHNNKKAFTFVTVHSAGHQVPWFKSMKSYEMLQKYLTGDF
jgi:carboxypeptidase C (cathepsin A)